MLVKDYELNFTFEIGGEFTEISKDKYSLFGVDMDTLHYFLYLDDNGQEYPFAMVKGKKCKDYAEYEKNIVAEVKEFEKLYPDATISEVITIAPEDRHRVERVSIEFNDGGYMQVVYFAFVNGYTVSASTCIEEDVDDYEVGLYQVMASIKEMDQE